MDREERMKAMLVDLRTTRDTLLDKYCTSETNPENYAKTAMIDLTASFLGQALQLAFVITNGDKSAAYTELHKTLAFLQWDDALKGFTLRREMPGKG